MALIKSNGFILLLFDKDFNYLDAGFTQVSGTSNTHVAVNSSKTISEKGYLYVYVSNESNTSFDVFFDDLRITHTKGAILQEDHYYPFGMNINALSSTAPLSKPNQFKYNAGTELTEAFDFDIYETPFRGYDAQLGRFNQIDLMADVLSSITPYNFGYNNPIKFNDPSGLIGEDCPNGDCGTIVVYGSKKAQRKAERLARKAERKSRRASEGNSSSGLSLAQESLLNRLKRSSNSVHRGIYAQYNKNGLAGVRNVLGHSRTLSSSTDGYEDAIAHSQKYMSQIGEIVQRGVTGTMLVTVAAPMLIEALPALLEGGAISARGIGTGVRVGYSGVMSGANSLTTAAYSGFSKLSLYSTMTLRASLGGLARIGTPSLPYLLNPRISDRIANSGFRLHSSLQTLGKTATIDAWKLTRDAYKIYNEYLPNLRKFFQ